MSTRQALRYGVDVLYSEELDQEKEFAMQAHSITVTNVLFSPPADIAAAGLDMPVAFENNNASV